jgi:hypothetical protein
MSSKFRAGVPNLKPTPESFVRSAPGKEILPWNDPVVRDDVGLQLNVKQPERLMIQLNWVSFHLKKSKVQIVSEALREYLRKELASMGVETE